MKPLLLLTLMALAVGGMAQPQVGDSVAIYKKNNIIYMEQTHEIVFVGNSLAENFGSYPNYIMRDVNDSSITIVGDTTLAIQSALKELESRQKIVVYKPAVSKTWFILRIAILVFCSVILTLIIQSIIKHKRI